MAHGGGGNKLMGIPAATYSGLDIICSVVNIQARFSILDFKRIIHGRAGFSNVNFKAENAAGDQIGEG